MFDTASEFDIEALRSRLGQMDDQALLRFGKSAAYMAAPAAYWNEPPRAVFLFQLEEARTEWRRRLQRRR